MNKFSIWNIFAYINLSLGIISIIFCINGKIMLSCFFILLASLLDGYNGRLSRKFCPASSLGRELHSLSDLISLGTAPAILLWKLSLSGLGIIGYLILLIFPICGAYKLARFDITQVDNVYTGIPITIAGAALALDGIATKKIGIHTGLTAILMLLFSYLMVSTIKFKKI